MKINDVKIVEKPWGREIWTSLTDEYASKILEIRKGHQTSLQYHIKKKESMYIHQGVLKVIDDKGEFILKAGESITISPGKIHRLHAVEDVVIIETSTPELDDVVRLHDNYGREDK